MRATTTTCPGSRSTSSRRPSGRLDSHNRWTGRRGLDSDITATTTPDAAGAPDGQALGTDEYGNASTVTRYGYLGAHQRETDTLTGVTLMGARLYVPSLGRFLSHDPVYGGNDTKYGYPVNPIAIIDVSGLAPTCGAVSSGCSKTPIYGYKVVKKWVWKYFGGNAFLDSWSFIARTATQIGQIRIGVSNVGPTRFFVRVTASAGWGRELSLAMLLGSGVAVNFLFSPTTGGQRKWEINIETTAPLAGARGGVSTMVVASANAQVLMNVGVWTIVGYK